MFQPSNALLHSSNAGAILHRSRVIPIEFTMTESGQATTVAQDACVTWLLTSTSQVQVLHGGEILKKGTEYNDFYGYLNSIEFGQQSLHFLKEQYQIQERSTAVAQLMVTLHATPFFERDADVEYNQNAIESQRLKMRLVAAERCNIRLPLPHQAGVPNEKQYPSRCLEGFVLQQVPLYRSQHSAKFNAQELTHFMSIFAENEQRETTTSVQALFEAQYNRFTRGDDLYEQA
jgi:hypothetical protein